jgi:hypothetical protein
VSWRRGAAVWLVLAAVYASTIGIRAAGGSDYAGDEPHHLLTADSIVADGDIDLTDQYRGRAYRDWYPGTLRGEGSTTDGHLNDPVGLGFALLIAPAYALGGPVAVELFLAPVAALGFALAVALARRLVPEPYATAAALVAGVSPPALAYATSVTPELTAGTLLAAACLLALQVRDRPRLRTALVAGGLIALLPWLAPAYLLPGLVIAVALTRWLARRRAGLGGLVALEVVVFSVVMYLTINDRLYGGLTPSAAAAPGAPPEVAPFPGGWLERVDRLPALWVDGRYGLLRWAPFGLLAFWALWLLWRSRRERVARALPEQIDVEVAATLLALVCAAVLFAAAFLAPTVTGVWFPGRHLVAAMPVAAALAAWGLRHAPRVGALLAALTVAASAWLYVALRLGEGAWASPPLEVPFGPAREALPEWGTPGAWAAIASLALVVALLAVALREWLTWRRSVADARGAYR